MGIDGKSRQRSGGLGRVGVLCFAGGGWEVIETDHS